MKKCRKSGVILKSENKCRSGINSLALRYKSFSSECLLCHGGSCLSVSLKQEESTSITRKNSAVWGSGGSRGFPARKQTCLFTLTSPINNLSTDIALSGVIHSKINGCQGKSGWGGIRRIMQSISNVR